MCDLNHINRKGQVLWIEPCGETESRGIWDAIGDKLCKLVDLSISEEETNKKRRELEAKQRELLMEQKIEEEKEDEIEEHDFLDNNEIVQRLDTDSTLHASDLPAMPDNISSVPTHGTHQSHTHTHTQYASLFGSNSTNQLTFRNSKPLPGNYGAVPSNTWTAPTIDGSKSNNSARTYEHVPKKSTTTNLKSSLETIPSPMSSDDTHLGIAETILKMHNSTEDVNGGGFHVVDMTDDDISTDDDFNDTPRFGDAKTFKRPSRKR